MMNDGCDVERRDERKARTGRSAKPSLSVLGFTVELREKYIRFCRYIRVSKYIRYGTYHTYRTADRIQSGHG